MDDSGRGRCARPIDEGDQAAGFVYRDTAGIDMFLDGPDAKFRDAVYVLFAGEKVRDKYLIPTPDVTEAEEATDPFRVLSLEAMAGMKLTSIRDKDRTRLRDFIGVGLIDETWPARFPDVLGARLQSLLDDPDG